MPIVVKFTAETYDDLMTQIWAFAGKPAPAPVEASIPEPEPVVVKRPRGRPPKAASTNGAQQPDFDVAGPTPEPEPEPEPVVIDTPKTALELKAKVIGQLQAAFSAGKVERVQNMLRDYGHGAKSFREMDVSEFPAIEAAIQKGALS